MSENTTLTPEMEKVEEITPYTEEDTQSLNDVFRNLYSVNVNDHTEQKNGLTYLSWAFAWAEVMKRYPTAEYEVKKFDDLPYLYDDRTGYMVFTSVTIEGVTREMWLAVMDGANKAMKKETYTYDTRRGKVTVQAATMTDINKAIMRCLVKNLAMFGLGLYIYAGEDLPEVIDEEAEEDAKKTEELRKEYIGDDKFKIFQRELKNNGLDPNKVYIRFEIFKKDDMTEEKQYEINRQLKELKKDKSLCAEATA